MNKQFENPFFRLQEYWNYYYAITQYHSVLDEDPSYNFTIANLSEYYDIPIEVVRADFASMRRIVNKLNNNLSHRPYLQIDEFTDANLSKVWFSKDDANATAQIEVGKLDNISFFLPEISSQKSYDVQYILNIEPDEYDAMTHFYSKGNNTTQKAMSSVAIKDSYRFYPLSQDKLDNIHTIDYMITNKKAICFSYKNNKGAIDSYDVLPIKIIYDTIDNIYAILGFCKNTDMPYIFRLDRIIGSVKTSKVHDISLGDTSCLAHANKVWGLQFFENEPHKVKVRFYNEGNVWEKVKKELASRIDDRASNLYEKDGYLYYEDDVYGISSFRTWLMGYGSSAIVEKPNSLRESIIDSLKRQLELYP